MDIPDDRDLCEDIAGDYFRNAKRMGADITYETARQVAAGDLQMVDALEREAPAPRNPGSQIVEELPPEPPTKAELLAMEQGDRFVKRDVDEVEAPMIETLGNINVDKRLKLIARVAMIGERDPSTNDYHHPALARQLEEIHANWTFGTKQFLGSRTQQEKDKRFFALLENLCDVSNGRIRPAWWVK